MAGNTATTINHHLATTTNTCVYDACQMCFHEFNNVEWALKNSILRLQVRKSVAYAVWQLENHDAHAGEVIEFTQATDHEDLPKPVTERGTRAHYLREAKSI